LFDPGTDYQYSNTNTILLGLVLEQVTGESIGQLYRERIIEPLGLQGTSFPDVADNSLPEPHAQGYTFLFQSSGGEEPIDATDWNPSWGWTAGAMISTVEDLLVYGQALGTGAGLLPPERQAERLDSFLPTGKPEVAYGLGLEGAGGWIGHQGLIPGFTNALFYHPELDAVVAVEANADYLSGDCPEEVPTMTNGVQGVPCDIPAEPIFAALAGALGKPFPLTHQVTPES
jgi:D-alanyl-D-alanine carboxypeptidase